jgi:peptidoglycan/xylan/chitin deacetylase (PgdA/CDA1 family)
MVLRKLSKCSNIWPIDEKAGKSRDGWHGWPEEKQFALILTHDVETAKGQGKCGPLVELEENLGFRSSFNFVACEYDISSELRYYLNNHGFEVGLHGLRHDGNLFKSRKIFQAQVMQINHYLKEWEAEGFRCPSMYHNLDWMCDLNITYDSSTFDTDPFEPQPDSVQTIFPFWVQGNPSQKGYIELPYTLPQDFTLFVLMEEKNIDIWKQKLDWIAERGGMALLITHPDYMGFDKKQLKIDEYPAEYYEEFLGYVKSKYKDRYWHVLPKEIARFWASNFGQNDFYNKYDLKQNNIL